MRRVAAVLAALLAIAACGTDDASPQTSPVTTITLPAGVVSSLPTTISPDTTLGNSTPTSSTPAPASAPATVPAGAVTLPPAPPSPTGVPGLDDTNAVCTDWAALLGSVQILRIAQAFGGVDDHGLNRAEVIASSGIQDAALSIQRSAGSWPDEIADERPAFDAFIAPYLTRIEQVGQALDAAAASPAQRQQIAAAWDDVLQRWNPDDPALQIGALPPELELIVDAAAADIGAKYPVFAADPTIATTQMNMPKTVQWLQGHCPSLADVGFGDGN